jgi:hypothetical protein
MYVRSMGTIAISNKDSKVSKGFTLAHEFAHFMDNWLGKKNKRNFASDDYNSVAGKIAKTFREKMENLDIATGYHKRTCECFARALEQYFAIKTGNDSEYSNQKYYIKDTKYFEETFSPMIEKFLSENEHLLKAFPLFTERKSNILTLLKGKKAQEGEVRTWGNNKQYKKVGGKWQPVNDGKSDTEKEALRSVGSEEKAKRNVKMLDTTFKTMQKALSQLMGDSVGQINPKLAKELSASIVAAQGESEFSNKMKMLDTVIQDMTLMKEAFMKSFKGMKDDSTMGMMFASSINTMIHHVNKHTKAIETAKAINKMLSMAYKAKYKLHDQSVKARLAA